ncbi:MAG: aminopeptidase P family N-terminal domain-containing protein, partial [Pseudomonadota bacterium]
MLSTKEKLAQLRAAMKRNKIDAYFVPSTDPHQSEYVPECWQRRKWLSGFSGSAGDLVITQNEAGLWTDGRYFIQAANELKNSSIALMKIGIPETPSIPVWLTKKLNKGQVLGVDPRVLSRSLFDQFTSALTKKG